MFTGRDSDVEEWLEAGVVHASAETGVLAFALAFGEVTAVVLARDRLGSAR